MKTSKIFCFILFIFLGFSSFNEAKSQRLSVNFSTFYNDLSPYGRWMDYPKYGGKVWMYDEPGFRPYYTRGHWEYTDYGWAWASDYDWGWAPFHYGRWEFDPYYGWIWIPGYEWASAWVAWSECDGYYGWAPLGNGLNINISFGSIPRDRWIYVPRRDICNRDLYNYYTYPRKQNNYFRNSVIINNIYTGGNSRYWSGPARTDVERYTGTRIEPEKIDYTRPGNVVTNQDRNKLNQDRSNSNIRHFDNNNNGRMDNGLPNRKQIQLQDNQQRNDQNREYIEKNRSDRNQNNLPKRNLENFDGNNKQTDPDQQNNYPRRHFENNNIYNNKQNDPPRRQNKQNPSYDQERNLRRFQQERNNQEKNITNNERMSQRQEIFRNQQSEQRNFNNERQNNQRSSDRQFNKGWERRGGNEKSIGKKRGAE